VVGWQLQPLTSSTNGTALDGHAERAFHAARSVAEAARLPRRVAVEGGATAAYRPLRPEELEHVRRKAGLESGHGVADTILRNAIGYYPGRSWCQRAFRVVVG